MERIALISDIHGNVPALEAVLADIARCDCARIFCLGDLAGKGPSSAEAVDLCRKHCERTVKGNWDAHIVERDDQPGARWHQERLGLERLRFLDTLPHVIDFWMSGKQVRLFHASQESIFHRVYVNASPEIHRAMFDNTPFTGDAITPDVVGYGDLHWAFLTSVEQRMLFNVGSVGNPLDMPLATYAIIEGDYGSHEPAPFSIQLVRLPYDIERAVRDAEEADIPELAPYIVELRTARYRGLPPLDQ